MRFWEQIHRFRNRQHMTLLEPMRRNCRAYSMTTLLKAVGQRRQGVTLRNEKGRDLSFQRLLILTSTRTKRFTSRTGSELLLFITSNTTHRGRRCYGSGDQMKWDVEFRAGALAALKNFDWRIFREVRARSLGFIGLHGARLLRDEFLRPGKEFDLRAYPKDKDGRRTITYSIGRMASYVRISSYPMNLFERGRTLRGGGREPGRFIVTRKFKQVMDSRLQGMLNKFDDQFFSDFIQKTIERESRVESKMLSGK